MKETTLGIDFEWEESPGDGRICAECKDPIFYNMYAMVIVSGPERKKTTRVLCESCRNSIDDE